MQFSQLLSGSCCSKRDKICSAFTFSYTREVTIAMWFHVLLAIVAIDLCDQGKIKIYSYRSVFSSKYLALHFLLYYLQLLMHSAILVIFYAGELLMLPHLFMTVADQL